MRHFSAYLKAVIITGSIDFTVTENDENAGFTPLYTVDPRLIEVEILPKQEK